LNPLRTAAARSTKSWTAGLALMPWMPDVVAGTGSGATWAARADLVDMEGYAIARACEHADVPCRMVKVVSDTADHGAALTWQEQMDRTAREIAAVVSTQL
jgi:hypothetical protein